MAGATESKVIYKNKNFNSLRIDTQLKQASIENRDSQEISVGDILQVETPNEMHEPSALTVLNSKQNDEGRLECFICHQFYQQPRILPCLHSFCSVCISNLQTYPCNRTEVKSSASSQDHSSFTSYRISDGNEIKSKNHQEKEENERMGHRRRERSWSRLRGSSEERSIFPRGKSQHAKAIEKRIARSSSCDDRFNENSLSALQNSKTSALHVPLRRSNSFAEENLRRLIRKSIVSSGSLKSTGEDINQNTDVEMADKRVILCPKCLREAEISGTLEELPRNFMLERLVAKHAFIHSGSNSYCQSCSQLGRSSGEKTGPNLHPLSNNFGDLKPNVTAYCVDCQINLCSFCESAHRKSDNHKWHQLIVLQSSSRKCKITKGSSSISSSDSSDYKSFSDSMSTIPESLREEPDRFALPADGRNASKSPYMINNVKKLKLPNLQKFSKLFNWKFSNRQSSQNLSDNESKNETLPKKIKRHSLHLNGLVNDGFEDRRLVEFMMDNNRETTKNTPVAKYHPILNGNNRNFEDADIEKLLGTGGKLDKDSKFDADSLKADPFHLIPCLRHPSEALKMFCVTCELCVCRECVVLQHNEHDWQLLTRHLFQNQMEEVDALIQQVLPRVEDVDHQLTSLEEVKDRLEERSQEVRGQINNFMDSFVDAIQKHRENLLEQLTSVVSARDCKLNVTQTHLEDMRSDVEHTCRFVAELLIGSSDLEILSMKKLITKRLRGFSGHDNRRSVAQEAHIRFCPTAEAHVINNFQMFGRVVDKEPCAAMSSLLTKGLVDAKVCHKITVAMNVCDSEGNVYTGHDVIIRAWIVASGKIPRNVAVDVQKNCREGMYSLTFTPNSRGTHFLHVTVNGNSVMNCPYKFRVRHRASHHQGSWQCCTFCHTDGRRDVPCGCGFFNAEDGYLGCVHGTSGHPGAYHWSCCGQTVKHSHCEGSPFGSQKRQVTV